MSNSGEKPPVYFRSLQLENVRCIGQRQTLSLTDSAGKPVQWTLILGDNGVGKTTLLQCLAWMRPVVSTDPNKEESKYFAPALSSEENNTLYSLIRRGKNPEYHVQAELRSDYSLGQSLQGSNGADNVKELKTGIELQARDSQLHKVTPDQSTPFESGESDDVVLFDPFIVAYGASRRPGTLKVDRGKLYDPLDSIFLDAAELYDAEDFLLRLDYRALKNDQEGKDHDHLQQLKRVIATVLPDVSCPNSIDVLGPEMPGDPSASNGVWYNTPYGRVPQSALSLGYRTTITWIADLALRLYERYPQSADALREPAIVLIDEIELHLHPRWQRRMMEYVSNCFPATQFIATAHSPLVVQAVERGNLAVLREQGGEVTLEMHSESVNDWRADQILASDLFGIPSRSRQIELLIKEQNSLLDKEDRLPSDESRLRVLERRLQGLRTAEDQGDQDAMNLIREVAEKLKAGGWNDS